MSTLESGCFYKGYFRKGDQVRTIKIDAQNTKEEAEKLVKLIGGKRNFIKIELKKHNYSYNPETDQKTCLLCNYVLDRGWKCPNCNQLLE